MKLNLFASSLILMTAFADINTDSPKVLSKEESKGTFLDLEQTKPEDHCCFIYYGDDFTERYEHPLCWNKETQRAQMFEGLYPVEAGKKAENFVKGIECGKNTWTEWYDADPVDEETLVLYRDSTKLHQSMAGKYMITLDKIDSPFHFTVGPYDDKVMPALTLFSDNRCQKQPTKFMYDNKHGDAGQYDTEAIRQIRTQHFPETPKSLLMRSNYRVEIYKNNKWQGTPEIITGAYQDEEDSLLRCQTISSSQMGSFRIRKGREGKATGYWKGITSSEAQKFKYTVGITSSSEGTSTQNSASRLQQSLETGWNASITADARVGFLGIGAGVAATGGMHQTDASQKALEFSIASEIKSTASEGTTTEHETTCTPKDGEERAGIWQWVITNEDFSVTAFTPHTICRIGDLAFTSPECSFWDCINVDCSDCKSQSVFSKPVSK